MMAITTDCPVCLNAGSKARSVEIAAFCREDSNDASIDPAAVEIYEQRAVEV
jgi:hypothetical protein